jgi:hypothetical protein
LKRLSKHLGSKVDKNDPELLGKLDTLYNLISQYDDDNVFNMDFQCGTFS